MVTPSNIWVIQHKEDGIEISDLLPALKGGGSPFGRLISTLARPSTAPQTGVMELPGPAPRVIRPQQEA